MTAYDVRSSDWSADVWSSDLEASGHAGQVRQFITMGSPLALRAIRERVPQPFRRPSLVAEWRNYYAATDLVTGGRGLPPGGLAHIHNHQRRGMPFPYHLPEDYLRSEEHTSELQSLMRISS